MNPETDQWTYKTLKEYFERVLIERELRYMQMFSDAKDALIKAEVALREYKATANEFRSTLKDQAINFITRIESENTAKELRNLISAQREQINTLQRNESVGEGGSKASVASKANFQSIVGIIIGIGGLVIAGVTLFLAKR